VSANLGYELGHGAGFHQCGAHRIADEIVHHAPLAETNFGFRGMNVDVDFSRRHFEEQQHHGIDRGRNNVAIGLGERVLHQAVADEASIHEYENRVAIELLDLGFGNESV
jgi:hypothetical protein